MADANTSTSRPRPAASVANERALFEAVDCPICGIPDYELLEPATYGNDVTEANIRRFYSSSSDVKRMDPLVRCRGCHLVLLSPRVREDIVVTSYQNAVDPIFFGQNPHRIRTFTRLFEKVLAVLGNKNPAGLNVLDVGCAGGAFPKAAMDLGCTVVGVEPSVWLCEQARQRYGVDLRPGLLAEQKFPPESYDIVTLWDVLEHLPQPARELEEIHRLLKRDGSLVVSVPDYDSIARKLLGKHWPFFLNVHLFYFTERTLSRLLEKQRFRLQGRFPLWQTLEFGYVLERAAAYLPGMGALSKALGPVRRLPVTYQMGQTIFIATKR